MSRRQKFDFMVSNLHWFDGFFVLAIALILMYLGLGPILGYDAVTHHQREVAMIALVPMVLLFDGVSRLHFVLRRSYDASIRDVLLVQGMWFSIKFTNVTAVVKFLLGFKTGFVRTPKFSGAKPSRTRAFFRAIRLTKIESTLGFALLTVAIFNVTLIDWDKVAPASILLPIWTSMYALFFLCSPIYAYMSYRTLVPMRYDRVEVSPRVRQRGNGNLVRFEALPKAAPSRLPGSAPPPSTRTPQGVASRGRASRATGDAA